MKHGKRPTVVQKKLLKAMGLNAENWLVVKDQPESMTAVHRISGKQRVINKNTARRGNV